MREKIAVLMGGLLAGLAVVAASGLVARTTVLREDTSLAAFYLLSLALGRLQAIAVAAREMALAMGVNIKALFTLVFGVGTALCAVAGALLGPMLAVQVYSMALQPSSGSSAMR